MSPSISVSTVWNALRHENAQAIISELQDLGFNSFELNVHLTESMLEEIETMLPDINIATLHNYCPLPEYPRDSGSGDFYRFSSPDPIERRKAVDMTLKTAEWASRLGAKAIVLHMGQVEMKNNHQQVLDLRLQGRNDEADEIVRQDLAYRETIIKPYLDAALKSASKLAEKIAGDVLLGIETRLLYTEIPTFDEMELFMQAIPPSAGGYWHDFGHVHMLGLVGIAGQEEFLSRYSGRMLGMHVHDVTGKHDHRPLTLGTIDFPRLMKYVSPDVIPVLEIHKTASAEEMVKSREILAKLMQH